MSQRLTLKIQTVFLGAERNPVQAGPTPAGSAEVAFHPLGFNSDARKGQFRPENKNSLFSFRPAITGWGKRSQGRMGKTF